MAWSTTAGQPSSTVRQLCQMDDAGATPRGFCHTSAPTLTLPAPPRRCGRGSRHILARIAPPTTSHAAQSGAPAAAGATGAAHVRSATATS